MNIKKMETSTILLIFAAIFSIFLVVIAFHVCLTIGMPWGNTPWAGVLPKNRRTVLIVNQLICFAVGAIVWLRALRVGDFAVVQGLVVALFSVGVVLNVITPGKKERAVWAPITLILAVSAAVVAAL
ncbi:hypothetical protein BDR26DRAFT_456313 [Obelidium mucronatum]|nr:hypothetical protein BDR26DRAFT_456313 [Obelidium mucronatum]